MAEDKKPDWADIQTVGLKFKSIDQNYTEKKDRGNLSFFIAIFV